MKHILIYSFIILVLQGCTSAHNSFIENINVASDDYNREKGLLNKYAFINRHDAIAITKDKDNNEIHHHRFYDRGFRRHCEYYIIFSPSDQEILGWGFENKSTAKYCEIRN